MKKTFFVFYFIIYAALFNAFAYARTITLATLDWEPYIGQNLKNYGYVAEIVKQAFERTGHSVELRFYPWARALDYAKKGRVDGYFPEYYAENINEFAAFSDPYPGGPLVLLARKDASIKYNSLSDLKPYRIGVVRGYVNTAEFDAATFLKKDEATNDLINIRKLLKNRIELCVIDEFVAKYIMMSHMPDQMGKVEFIDPPLEYKELYVCISKKKPYYKELITDFNKGLKELKEGGALKAILSSHGF